MTSQQEAERVIRELTGEFRLDENVYESGRKFLRELLLHIDARAFKKASLRKEYPYASFKIHSSHIEVEFNDDGFTKRDLEQICLPSTTEDKSTRENGLSSVFKYTAKIYLQSGNFSLDLRLSSSEGKIKPSWVSPSATIPDALTRMIIYFHDYGTKEHLERLKGVILAQFEVLKAESLLFLTALRRVTVEFYGKGGELCQSKRLRKHWMKENRELLKATIDSHYEKEGKEEKGRLFYVTGRGGLGRRNVTLAFPLTDEGRPLIDARENGIFNVLFISESKCNFLMNADFDFDDQHKLRPNSRRNEKIRIWIAAAFLQVISKFFTDHNLRYEWPLFLPPIAHKTPLSLEIRYMAQRNLLVKVYNQSSLRCMNEITVLPDHLKDENGQPLLEPFVTDNLVSTEYPQRVVEIFKEHGAKTMQDETFWAQLELDMRLGNPKMHGKYTTEEWHARVARFLLRFSQTSSLNASKVKSIAIVPLKDGTWTSMLSDPVYFPRTGDISIPDTEDLRVVAPPATRDPDRYALLKYLGITEPSVETTRKLVRESLISAPDTISLKRVNDYLKYLYLTHEASDWNRYDYEEVLVLSADSELKNPQHDSKPVYLPGKDHPFSPESLLGPTKPESSLSHSFLHPETLSYVPNQDNASHISWRRWLCDYVGVREEVCLELARTGKLSPDFLDIVSQSPDKLLELLEHLLSKGEVDLSGESPIISEIRQLSISIPSDDESKFKLQDAWLPLEPLIDIVESYMEQTDQFPFLRSIQDDTGGIDTKWNFLSQHFLVGNEDNLDFRLAILRSIRRSDPKNDPNRQLQKILNLYASIQSRFTASGKMITDREKLRNFFNESGVVYFFGTELEWTSSSSCLWEAPPGMVTMRSLKSCYDLQSSNTETGRVQALFLETIGIQNAKLEQLVAELNELRIRNDEDPANILRMYDFLNTNIPSSQDIRTFFESSPLIFIPNGPYTGWHTSTEVLWSSNTDLCGMGTLDDTYKSLRGFFVDKLGIESLSLRILYDRLIKSPECKPQQMKEAIFILNDFLRSETAFLDPQPVRNAEIFPVKDPDGSVSLRSIETDFAIGDNDNLRIHFESHIRLLDLNLGEFYRLKPFFEWLKLESRYLSRCVREDVTVISKERGGLFGAPAVPIPYKKRDLKAMARYFTRVAANFGSPYCRSGIKALHKQLCKIECVQVWRIKTFFILQQNGETFVTESQLSKAHIAEPDGRLTIYVPMDPLSQDICFVSVLPRKLAVWIMQDPENSGRPHVDIEMVNALTAILASETTSLDEILDELGIARLSYDGLSDDGDDATRHRISFKNVVERPRKADSLSFGLPVSNTSEGPSINIPDQTETNVETGN